VTKTSDWQKLGEFVRETRIGLGLTKVQAYAAAHISKSTWDNVEAGKNPAVSDETLSRMARALQLEPKALLTRAGRAGRPSSHRGPGRIRESAQEALVALLDQDPDLDEVGRRAIVAVYEALTRKTT
jgi:transcriptional regulator with XRE-family HTH domain